MSDLIKKGTIFECYHDLNEAGQKYKLFAGDRFTQQEDSDTPIFGGYKFRSTWNKHLKIIKEKEELDDEWLDIMKSISKQI